LKEKLSTVTKSLALLTSQKVRVKKKLLLLLETHQICRVSQSIPLRDATRNDACVSRLSLSFYHRWLLYCTFMFGTRLRVARKLKCTKMRRNAFLQFVKIRQIA